MLRPASAQPVRSRWAGHTVPTAAALKQMGPRTLAFQKSGLPKSDSQPRSTTQVKPLVPRAAVS